MPDTSLILGTNEYELEHEMALDLRSQHLHVLGATGTGKSRFLLSLIMQDIKNRTGLCLIDPHGELVEHVVDWLGKNEHIASRRTIRILDLKDESYSFGFNPLKATSEEYVSATVDQAANAMASVMGGTDLTQTPLLRMTLNAVCTALSHAGLTLNEAPYLLSPNYPEQRLAITSTITNPTYARVWETYNYQAEKQPKLYIEQFQPAERRFIPFIANQFIRSIVGQNENVIDLKRSMDDGEILLVDLSRTGGKVPPESSQIIGRLLVNNLVAKAYERPPRKARAFNLYIDEVQNFLSGDVPEILSQCRKFGLHLTIANQYLQQLREAGELIYHGVMGTARNKVCFALDNPEDAEIMSRRIFAGQYDFEKVKTTLIKPTVVGHEIIRLQSMGTTTTKTQGTTDTKNATSSRASSRNFSEGASSGEGTSDMNAESLGVAVLGGQELDLTRQTATTASGASKFSGENWASGQSSAQGMSEGRSTGKTQSDASGSTTSYTETLKPILKDLPTAVYSLEELKHQFTDHIITLPNRQAYAVLAGQGMAKISTLDVPDLIVSEKRRARMNDTLKSGSGIHKPPAAVHAEITERFQLFMEAQREKEELAEEEIEFDPMNPMA